MYDGSPLFEVEGTPGIVGGGID